MIKNNTDLDSWDNWTSDNYLKSNHVNSENEAFVCINVEVIERDNQESKLDYTLERNEVSYIFTVNKTNATKLKELGLKTPRAAIGKKFYFKKVLTRDPKKNVEVEGLRVWKVE